MFCFFFFPLRKVEGIFFCGGRSFFSVGERSCFGLKSCIWCCYKAMEEAGIKLWLAYTDQCFVNDLRSFPMHKPKCCVHTEYLSSTALLQLDVAMHILQLLVLF